MKASRLSGLWAVALGLAAAECAADAFFGVDSACSWLARPGCFRTPSGETDLHRYTVGKIAETGFAQVRERLSWNEVNPKPDVWDFSHYIRVCSLYQEKGIRVSGMFHDAPKWMETKGKLPTDLKAVYDFAKRLGETFGDLVEVWEFWNEEDIGFCEASAWDYAAAAKAACLGFKDARPNSPALMGALCKPTRSAYDARLFENDLGRYTDAMNFHTYASLAEQSRVFAELKDFLAGFGLGERAIWVTESGTHEEGLCERDGAMPGQRAHSPEQELIQASVAARSQLLMMMAGVSRDYFFVFPPYNEIGGKKDWGMMRRDGTLKPVAAMFREMIARVGRAELLGETMDGYLFRQPDGALTLCTVGAALPTYRDGVTDAAVVRPAAKRGRIGVEPRADEDRRVVLQLKLDDDAFPLGGGKSFVEFSEKSDRLTLVVYNLDGVAKVGSLSVEGGTVAGLPPTLSLPAWGRVEVPCTYRPAATNETERLTFGGTFGGRRITRLVASVTNPAAIRGRCTALPLDLADDVRWERNDSATSYATSYDAAARERVFRFAWTNDVDRWAYPRYALKPDELKGAVTLEFEIRAEQGKVENDFVTQNAVLFEKGGAARHVGFAAPLGTWETRRIDLASEKGLGNVASLSIGLNPAGHDLVFRLRNVRLYRRRVSPVGEWRLEPGVTRSGSKLVVDVREGQAGAAATASVDLSCFPEGFEGRIRCSGKDVANPPESWLGLKFMIRCKDAAGRDEWPQAAKCAGTFDDVELRFAHRFPNGLGEGLGTLTLGLQSASGRVVFDLDTLRLEPAVSFKASMTNAGHRCVYAPEVCRAPRRRGVMLPAGPMSEDDFKTLKAWGATLARYQMVRNWHAEDDNRDLAEYNAWLDAKLDLLDSTVLPLAEKCGISVVVDLHVVPGGRRDGDMNMFYESKYAEAFVECWKKIARRFRGRRNVYGYDLVNEPCQRLACAPGCGWWDLQRRAAEAVRAIDPNVPIVLESNEWDSPAAYEYMSPLALTNVVYQVHMYHPSEFTHQLLTPDRPACGWPDEAKGWTKDLIRKTLAPVRAFEQRHGAKIYVGEFSAVAWAEGAAGYLRDCIEVFEEYGWDWTYHAFREFPGWSVEHEADRPGAYRPSTDNPRLRELTKGFGGGRPPEAPQHE